MTATNARPVPIFFFLFLVAALPAAATRTNVTSWTALQTAIGGANPGDTVALADGIYNAPSPIGITRKGTQEHPIVIMSANLGGAQITGSGGFQMNAGAQYVTVRGFQLLHKSGGNHIDVGASFCRFSHNLFQCQGSGAFLQCDGDDNEADYNTFQHKSTEFQMIDVLGPSGKMAKRNWFHHNYFNDFQNSNANNSACIELGYSSRSMDSSFTLIEWNLFTDCRGENEGAICVKSGGATIRYNTIGKGSTEIDIRHGNGSKIYGNIFLSTEGGLRFYGDDHLIYNNYFIDCNPALNLGNGKVQIPPGPLDEHDIPDRCQVVFNTFVNNQVNVTMIQESDKKGLNDLKFCNNLIVGGPKAVDLGIGQTPGAVWDGNVIWNNNGGAGNLPAGSYTNVDPKLILDAGTGMFRLQAGSPVIGAAKGSFPYVTEDMDGRPRTGALDVGAEQYAQGGGPRRPLTPDMIGWQADSSVTIALPVRNHASLVRAGLLVSLSRSALSLPPLHERLTGVDGRRPASATAAGAWVTTPDHE